eukprot:1289892-Rhodomonas_salina.2
MCGRVACARGKAITCSRLSSVCAVQSDRPPTVDACALARGAKHPVPAARLRTGLPTGARASLT